ncbi:glycerol kinase GlpK [Brevibacterium senegalense]|uniref:glycerol kinase GlpK n=1 Tax=Brevibacterium senegalense TaxID=1033736 RepID=UPI00030F4774|nr:glycerol kinase GlpK [Brevibacterium senegalense]
MTRILAIDEGTTSTRAAVLDGDGRTVASASREFHQSFPQPGRVEHDALEIWRVTREMIGQVLGTSQLTAADIDCIGITDQRETTVVWDRTTGRPLAPAIVWQDTRGGDIVARLEEDHGDRITRITGLPPATYFSAVKLLWLLEEVPEVRQAAESGRLLFGTIDTWLIWNLTGGVQGGLHLTDVTNASRTMLMDLKTLDWSDEMLALTGIPRDVLPRIRPSIGDFGVVDDRHLLGGVPITGVLGDQQAAAFGQCAFSPGDTKSTYGTGCFLLTNTGDTLPRAGGGLITTVAYQQEGRPAQYALEGSIAVAGSLVQWLRDNLGIIRDSAEVEELADSVQDSGDVYFVPAFSGLFAPRWKPDARGTLVGLTRYSTRAHIARAALESTVFQTAEVIEVLRAESGFDIASIRADGGMAVNDALLQFQADISDCEVVRGGIESTVLGAALAAGIGRGTYGGTDDVRALWQETGRWTARMDPRDRAHRRDRWESAVQRSLGWAQPRT